jgi:hypothetical protein
VSRRARPFDQPDADGDASPDALAAERVVETEGDAGADGESASDAFAAAMA